MSRADKVAGSLKEEISKILHQELNDPRIGFVTITRVEIKPDLRFARIYYSIMGTEKEIKAAQEGLESAVGFIRKLIGQRVRLRYTPELAFKYDESLAYSQHISDVLDEIKRKKSDKS